MFRPRIIPILLLKGEGVVKTVKFTKEKYIGDPINAVRIFNDLEVDELIFIDITATKENRKIDVNLVKQIGDEAFMPFAVGGGIKTLSDAKELMNAGAEKIIINSEALKNMELIYAISKSFGNQSVVLSVDVRKNLSGRYIIYGESGTCKYDLDLKTYCRLAEENGVGEILINSIDNDGMMNGYDNELIKLVSNHVSVPVVACGGAGSLLDLSRAYFNGNANAVAAGSIFVFHGPRKAVLINYPSKNELKEIFNQEKSLEMTTTYQRCTRGLWDTTVPGIEFDDNGVSNYAKMFDNYIEQYPRGKKGIDVWQKFVKEMKDSGKNNDYDCIIGVSGGTDSSYLLHIAKQLGLRPLAVTLDNGWASDISVKNIKKITQALNIDLETYVIDYEEIKDILKSYIKAGLPWIDFPTDHAIKSILYRTAKRENIKHILIGHDFRSEGTQPNEWTYGDSRQLSYIQKKNGTRRIKSFPNMSLYEHIYLGYVKGIKMIYPFFFIDYKKSEAQKLLIEKYDWQYYGGHHHENMFTKFAIAYWMPKKFGIDKRIITLSAQILSGDLTREKALKILEESPYDPEQMERDKDYIIKKLGMTLKEFDAYWSSENKNFHNYPSFNSIIEKVYIFIKPFIKFVVPQLPAYFVQLEIRNKKKNF